MKRTALLVTLLASTAALAACGSDGAAAPDAGPPPPDAGPPPPDARPPTALACDDTMKAAFEPDANTAVTLVQAFKKGDELTLAGTPAWATAANDLCLVKLNVGPGHPGPAEAPSTSAGIGIEIWLPSPANWNGKLHVLGGSGWAGGASISSTTEIGGANAANVAGTEGSVSAVTDTGHTVGDGSFALNPDGSINTTLWTDFAERSIHEMAVKTRALAAAYYLAEPTYAYWDGCSTGGRQGHMEAQAHPADFDGILAGAPALNWTRLSTASLYPQIVMQRDLLGVPLTAGQLALASAAAVSACDTALNGQHEGFLSDPASCRYDPTTDPAVLCAASGGTNASADCLSAEQAYAVNKIWYGPTTGGSVPSPAADNGFAASPSGSQLWYGLTRGTRLSGLAGSTPAGVPTPFPIATDQLALSLEDPRYATEAFTNATGNGANQWLALSYADLAQAFARGLALQPQFGNINTDDPDLSAFRDRGGKMLAYHGLADVLIPPQGSIDYYTRVVSQMGDAEVQRFYRLFLVPGFGHCLGVGSAPGIAGTSPPPNPPLPANGQLFGVLVDWVEKGIEPTTIVVATMDGMSSRPLCPYPQRLTYVGGDVTSAASYTCQ